MKTIAENLLDPLAEETSAKPKFLVKLDNVSLQVPTLTVKDRQLSVNPLRMLTGFYANSSGRTFKKLLSNIDLGVRPGQRFGLIGGNGAGKTTLLRLIAGVYKPSSGDFTVNGKAYGLFNIQLGMNGSATGVENIYLRGLQMGLSLSEIRERVDEISEFTELGSSIHELFGNYSAGMKLRLSFAISTILKPDVLLMDEWIGSGDENFKVKVQKRMNEMVIESKALVVATHNGPLIRRLCTHGLVLDEGKVLFSGPVGEALEVYAKNHHDRKTARQKQSNL